MKKTMIALATLLTFSASGVSAAEISVAVAANFTAPIKEISAIYEKESGNKILASFGATGAFYAQIKNGAPYQVLFAADAKTPKKIVDESLGIDAKPYAFGKLVLWSSADNFIKQDPNFILSDAVKKIAVANPKLRLTVKPPIRPWKNGAILRKSNLNSSPVTTSERLSSTLRQQMHK